MGRRPHNKTRTGCTTCKQRRIKCDEGKPVCNNCIARKLSCSYQFSLPRAIPLYNESLSSSQSPAAVDFNTSVSPFIAPNPLPGPSTPSFTVEELQLLHHWTAQTSLTFSKRESHRKIWQITLPEIAFSKPYLLHGVFALAALHKAYLLSLSPLTSDDRHKLVTFAAHHEDLALQSFRNSVQEIVREDCQALFLFNSIVTLFLFDSWRHGDNPFDDSQSKKSDRPLTDTGTCMTFLRSGILSMMPIICAWLLESPLAPLIPHGVWSKQPEPETPEQIEQDQRLTALEKLWNYDEAEHGQTFSCTELTQIERNSLTAALVKLRTSYLRQSVAFDAIPDSLAAQAMTKPHTNHIDCEDPNCAYRPASAAIAWLLAVDDAYVGLLQKGHPAAMVLLAHYAVLLQRTITDDYYWCMRGVAVDMLMFAANRLREEQKGWIEWPLSVMKNELETRVDGLTPG